MVYKVLYSILLYLSVSTHAVIGHFVCYILLYSLLNMKVSNPVCPINLRYNSGLKIATDMLPIQPEI